MDYNYNLLRKEIKKQTRRQGDFAKALGMSPVSFSSRINNRQSWTQDEMANIMRMIGKTADDIPKYFYRVKK